MGVAAAWQFEHAKSARPVFSGTRRRFGVSRPREVPSLALCECPLLASRVVRLPPVGMRGVRSALQLLVVSLCTHFSSSLSFHLYLIILLLIPRRLLLNTDVT